MTLAVNLPPTITSQPTNQSVLVGATATFSVAASGTGTLTYKWFKNGGSISGATSTSYTTPTTVLGDSGAIFTVKVTNTYGNVTSSAATLTVTAPVAPTITTQPLGQTVTLGSAATFSSVAAGTAPLSYQWFKNGTSVSGATSASYTTPATVAGDNGAAFTVQVTNAAGNITSNPATLTVNLPPTISTQPTNQTVILGATVTFSVAATGTGALTYQWSKNGAQLSGATSASYTTPATVSTDNGATFYVKVTNSYGNVTSATVTLTLNIPPSITTQPSSQTVTLGATATFSVVASGTGTLTYQWSKNGGAISGATSASYTTPATVVSDNGASFTVKVTNTYGNVTSNSATLTLNLPASISTPPVGQTVNLGATATFSVVASGTGTLTYQWLKNGSNISGATSASYTTPAAATTDNGASFTVKVTNTYGNVTSSAAILTVNPVVVTVSPTSVQTTTGTTQTFTASVTGAVNTSVTWSVTGGSTKGTINSSGLYTAPSIAVNDTVIAKSVADTTKTASATVTVKAVTVTISPTSITLAAGMGASFTATVTGGTTSNINWSVTEGAGGSVDQNGNYTTPATAGTYHVVATSQSNPTAKATATVTVVAPIIVTITPASADLLPGGKATFNSNTPVTWAFTSGIGGSMSRTTTQATYTAPSSSTGPEILTATSTIDPSKSAPINIWVHASGSPAISAFTASALQITAGQAIILSWAATGATSGDLTANPQISGGVVSLVDPTTVSTLTLSPHENTNYVLSFSNDTGTDQKTISVGVTAPVVDSFSADQLILTLGTGTTLRGSFHNGTATLQPGFGSVASGFAVSASPTTRTVYTLTVTNSLGVSSTSTVTVTPRIPLGTFTLTGDMDEPRVGHVATRLLDGRVLLSGGSDSSGTSSTLDADVFDPSTGTFSPPEFKPGMGQSATLLLDGKVLLAGGSMYPGIMGLASGNFTIWDPLTGLNTVIGGFQRMKHSATLLLDGRVLIVGGYTCHYQSLYIDSDSTAFIFDPKDLSQSPVGSLVSDSGPNTALLLPDGRVLIAFLSTAELFDPSTQKFTTLPVPEGTQLGQLVLLSDGRVLCGNQVLDTQTLSFLAIAFYPSDIPPTLLENGNVLTGYLQSSDFPPSLYPMLFDPSNGTGLAIPSALVSLVGPTTTLLQDGRLLIAGGRSYDYPNGIWITNGKAEIFDPQNQLNISGNGGIADEGAVIPFTLTGALATQPVAWTCTGGTIDASGRWSAPMNPGLYWIKATSQTDATVKAAVLYRVRPIDLAFSPSSVVVTKGAQWSLKANITGAANPSLIWSVLEGAAAGSITQSGLFTAGTTPGLYHVVATSIADPTKSATCLIQVPSKLPPVITQFTADKTYVVAGAPITFNWNLQLDDLVAFEMYMLTPSGELSGLPWTQNTLTYVSIKNTNAPIENQTFTLVVGDGYGNSSKSISINVVDPQAIQLTPPTAVMLLGDTQQFAVTNWATGQAVNNLSWSQSPSIVGSISAGGLFSSTAVGSTTLQVSNLDTPTLQPSTASITVVPRISPLINTFSTGGALPLKPGATANLSWTTSSATSLILTSSAGDRWDVSQSCIAGSGGISVTPIGTTSYTLLASNSLGSVSQVIQVPVSIGVGIQQPIATVSEGGTLQLSAVTNGATGVIWSVLEANGGSITQTGLYTAPLTSGYFTIVAVIAGNPALTDSLRIFVGPGVPITVVGSSLPANSSITVTTGSTTTFSSSYLVGVIWSVLEPGGGTITNPNGMSSGGVYTAPQTPGTYTVVASSYVNASLFGQFTVVVGFPITITPSTLTMPTGATQKFGYTIIAQTNQVTWSASGGTIGADGTYTAPLVPGTYFVTVTGVDNPNLSIISTVTVIYPDVTLTVTPIPNLFPGQTIQMGYQSSTGDVTWSATGGTFSGSIYTAPTRAGTYILTATSILNPNVSVSVSLTVLSPQIMIAPSKAVVAMSSTYQFQWATTGGTLIWSVIESGGGSVNSTGLYSAPTVQGTYTVKAVSSLDNTVVATAVVIVNTTGGSGGGSGGGISSPPQMVGVQVSPALVNVKAGSFQSFNATVGISDNQAVTWKVAGNPSTAFVDGQGIFVASRSGQYQVVATSVADGTSWGSAVVVVLSSVDTLADATPVALQRQGYTVTALNSGKLLIAGGWDGSSYLSDCYLYDPTTKAFTQTGSMLETRYSVLGVSCIVSAGRAWHIATKLNDGRVLIANGVGKLTREDGSLISNKLSFAQIYNPLLGAFQLLPGRLPDSLIPGGMGATTYHEGGVGVALGDGTALLVGGMVDFTKQTLFTPATGLLSDLIANVGMPDPASPSYGVGIGQWPAATTLSDGRALVVGGFVPGPMGPNPDSCIDSSATIYNPQTGFSPVGPMGTKRVEATATRLADGRVLVAGGSSTTYTKINGKYFFKPTNTVEIFDPATGLFSSTFFDANTGLVAPIPGMKSPRSGHDAILLPTGKVLVVGGYASQTVNADGSAVIDWNPETELFDPDTNSWSVMDDLGYGLQDPKLALLPDGSVFIAGTQITSDAPAAQASLVGNGKLKMAAGKLGATTAAAAAPSATPTTVFGVLNSAWRVWQPEPEEAALRSVTTTPAGDLIPFPDVTQISGTPNLTMPASARISVPLPVGADQTPGTQSLWAGVNRRHRYFILKVQKPSKNHMVTGVTVSIQTGGQTQDVLVNEPVKFGLGNGFDGAEQVLPPEVIPLQEPEIQLDALLPEDQFSLNDWGQEKAFEASRKQWIQQGGWRPVDIGTLNSQRNNLIEYYRVRVTFDANRPSTINYGMIGGVVVSPPSDTVTYKFKLHYSFLGLPISQPFEIPVDHPRLQAHWSTAQFFRNSWFGSWNNDKWVNKATFDWLSDPSHRSSLGPVNDITLEHGRNTGHGGEHFTGDRIDMFHPGYQAFTGPDSPGVSGGGFRDQYLIPYLQIARKDYTDPKTTPAQAIQLLSGWVNAARTRSVSILGALPAGNRSQAMIYMITSPNPQGTELYCDSFQLYQLLTLGRCDAYARKDAQGNVLQQSGSVDLDGVGGWASQYATRFQPWSITNHSDHLHLKIAP